MGDPRPISPEIAGFKVDARMTFYHTDQLPQGSHKHTWAGAGVFFLRRAQVLTAPMRAWDTAFLLFTVRAVPLREDDMVDIACCIMMIRLTALLLIYQKY